MSFSYQEKKRCSVCEVHFVIANMKYLGAQSGRGFLIIKAWRIQFSRVLFVYNNPIPSVSIRRWNTTRRVVQYSSLVRVENVPFRLVEVECFHNLLFLLHDVVYDLL